MISIASVLEELASQLGGIGLFVVALFDSSVISLPEINDLLLVLMVTQNRELMLYYAGMATLGSMSGCLLLYFVGRKGGEAVLRKRLGGSRFEKWLVTFKRFGVFAIIVPAVLPPPAPFKAFILLSGITNMPLAMFCKAVVIGRGIRYFGEGLLALRYGEQAVEFLHAHGALLLVVIVGAGCLSVIVAYCRNRLHSE